MTNSDKKDNSSLSFERGLWIVIGILIVVVIGVVLATTVFRLVVLKDRVFESADTPADQQVLERAEDAVRSAELVLSFLEGASVLLTVAAGIAVLYGFREIGDIRSRLDSELENLKGLLKQIEPYRASFDQVPVLTKQLENTIEDVSALVQADQEFRLNNHNEAYGFAQKVLQDPDHPDRELNDPILMALFITGWLEIHHVSGKIDEGIRHLKIALDKQPDWHSVRASYGVGLRRKAMQLKDDIPSENFINRMHKAEGELLSALGDSPKLIDFNHESFWGAVGGIQRDTGRFDAAIQSYQRALEITPGSSYPQGNLASLYLRETKVNSAFDPANLFIAFTRAVQFARAELAVKPNDYFLLMDIAMASTVLGQQDEEKFKDANEFFELAMNMKNVGNLQQISRRGWLFLVENCPEGTDWNTVRNELKKKFDAMPTEE